MAEFINKEKAVKEANKALNKYTNNVTNIMLDVFQEVNTYLLYQKRILLTSVEEPVGIYFEEMHKIEKKYQGAIPDSNEKEFIICHTAKMACNTVLNQYAHILQIFIEHLQETQKAIFKSEVANDESTSYCEN